VTIKALGRRVSVLRKQAGLSRAELAERSGLGESHIGLIETGKRRDLRLSTLRALAVALKTSVESLAGHG
jgi:transcriptional regulator with XRE-family HTH domain